MVMLTLEQIEELRKITFPPTINFKQYIPQPEPPRPKTSFGEVAGEFGRGLTRGVAFGFGPKSKADTTAEKVAGIAGELIGSVVPIGAITLFTGGAGTPAAVLGRLETGLATKLAPRIGEKLAPVLARSLTKEAVGGAIYGTVRGAGEVLLEKKPVKEAIKEPFKEAAFWAGMSFAVGSAGRLLKDIRKAKPQKLPETKTVEEAAEAGLPEKIVSAVPTAREKYEATLLKGRKAQPAIEMPLPKPIRSIDLTEDFKPYVEKLEAKLLKAGRQQSEVRSFVKSEINDIVKEAYTAGYRTLNQLTKKYPGVSGDVLYDEVKNVISGKIGSIPGVNRKNVISKITDAVTQGASLRYQTVFLKAAPKGARPLAKQYLGKRIQSVADEQAKLINAVLDDYLTTSAVEEEARQALLNIKEAARRIEEEVTRRFPYLPTTARITGMSEQQYVNLIAKYADKIESGLGDRFRFLRANMSRTLQPRNEIDFLRGYKAGVKQAILYGERELPLNYQQQIDTIIRMGRVRAERLAKQLEEKGVQITEKPTTKAVLKPEDLSKEAVKPEATPSVTEVVTQPETKATLPKRRPAPKVKPTETPSVVQGEAVVPSGVESHQLLRKFIEGGNVPYTLPEKPISDAVIAAIRKEIPTVKSVDDLNEYANAFWNLQAKRVVQGIGSAFKNKKEAYEFVRKNSHQPDLGMSVVKVGKKEYIVTHEPMTRTIAETASVKTEEVAPKITPKVAQRIASPKIGDAYTAKIIKPIKGFKEGEEYTGTVRRIISYGKKGKQEGYVVAELELPDGTIKTIPVSKYTEWHQAVLPERKITPEVKPAPQPENVLLSISDTITRGTKKEIPRSTEYRLVNLTASEVDDLLTKYKDTPLIEKIEAVKGTENPVAIQQIIKVGEESPVTSYLAFGKSPEEAVSQLKFFQKGKPTKLGEDFLRSTTKNPLLETEFTRQQAALEKAAKEAEEAIFKTLGIGETKPLLRDTVLISKGKEYAAVEDDAGRVVWFGKSKADKPGDDALLKVAQKSDKEIRASFENYYRQAYFDISRKAKGESALSLKSALKGIAEELGIPESDAVKFSETWLNKFKSSKEIKIIKKGGKVVALEFPAVKEEAQKSFQKTVDKIVLEKSKNVPEQVKKAKRAGVVKKITDDTFVFDERVEGTIPIYEARDIITTNELGLPQEIVDAYQKFFDVLQDAGQLEVPRKFLAIRKAKDLARELGYKTTSRLKKSVVDVDNFDLQMFAQGVDNTTDKIDKCLKDYDDFIYEEMKRETFGEKFRRMYANFKKALIGNFFEPYSEAKEFPRVRNFLRRAQDIHYVSLRDCTNQLHYIMEPVLESGEPEKNLAYLTKIVSMGSVIVDREAGKAVPNAPEIYQKLTLDELKTAYQKLIDEMPPAVKKAWDRHTVVMRDVAAELLKRGKIIKGEVSRPEMYYPHIVLAHLRDEIMKVPGMPAKLKDIANPHLLERKGTQFPFSHNYPKVMTIYLDLARKNIMLRNLATEMRESVDLLTILRKEKVPENMRNKIWKEILKFGAFEERTTKEGKTRLISKITDGSVYEIPYSEEVAKALGYYGKKPADGKIKLRGYFYAESSIPDEEVIEKKFREIIRQASKTGNFDLTAEQVARELGVKGETWLVPEPVYYTLREFHSQFSRSPIINALTQYTSYWKRIILNTAGIPFQLNNLAGDMINIVREDPQAVKNLGKAYRLYKFIRSVHTKGPKTEEEKKAFWELARMLEEHRVDISGLMRQIPQGTFPYELDPRFRQITQRHPLTYLWSQAVQKIEGISEARETIPRIAKFITDFERIMNGKKPVTTSIDVLGLEPIEAAGKIAREVSVDYGKVPGEFRTFIRGLLFPFATFWVHNTKNWANFTLNAFKGNPRALATLGGIFSFHLAAWLWNNTGWRWEIEKDLPPDARKRFHIVTDIVSDDGKNIVFSFQTPLDIAAQMLMVSDIPVKAAEVMHGRPAGETVAELPVAAAGTFGKTLTGLLGPVFKAPVEAMINRSLFTGQPVAPQRIAETPEGVKMRITHALAELLPPAAPYMQTQRSYEPSPEAGPFTGFARWLVLRPLDIERAMGVMKYSPESQQTRERYEILGMGQELTSLIPYKLQDAAVGVLSGDNPNALTQLLQDFANQGIFVSGEQIANAFNNPRVLREVTKRQLQKEKSPERRVELSRLIEFYNMMQQQEMMKGISRGIRPYVQQELEATETQNW